MFKILSTYICRKKYIKCNIWRVAIRPSYIWDARFLKVNIHALTDYNKYCVVLKCFNLVTVRITFA